ncbi:DUF916 domain-containing protein [Lactococcus garvieae]|uniref:DUF916 domain-containing protein n=1 Tax=Lactococcus garvieae TaxID=1363 RepID=UPI003243D212
MKKNIFTFFLAVFCFLCTPGVVADNNAPQGGYSVSPIPSEHQTEGANDYFDIRWTPSAQEEFGLVISNKSDKDQTYEIQVNKARTNKNGIIDYSDSTPEVQGVKYKLTEMVEIPKEVIVPAGSKKTVTGTLTLPNEEFNGILMGGVHVSEKIEMKGSKSVSNTVAYNIPFVVRGNIDTRPKPDLELKKVSLEKYSSKQSSLDVLLSNKNANLLKESEFHAEIKDVNGKTITKSSSKLDLTPETIFIYPVKLPEQMRAGTYSLIISIEHGKDYWEFKKEFTVSSSESQEISKRSDLKNTPWVLYSLIILILVSIVSLLCIIWYRKRRLKKKLENSGKLRRRH